MQKREMSMGGMLLLLSIFILSLIGWVLNIAEVFSSPWIAENAGMLIVRIIGIIIPFIGAVLGYV